MVESPLKEFNCHNPAEFLMPCLVIGPGISLRAWYSKGRIPLRLTCLSFLLYNSAPHVVVGLMDPVRSARSALGGRPLFVLPRPNTVLRSAYAFLVLASTCA